MKYNSKIIISLSFLVAIMPFLGFPGFIKDIFFISAGIIIAILVYITNKIIISKDIEKKIEEKNNTSTFVENKEEFINKETNAEGKEYSEERLVEQK